MIILMRQPSVPFLLDMRLVTHICVENVKQARIAAADDCIRSSNLLVVLHCKVCSRTYVYVYEPLSILRYYTIVYFARVPRTQWKTITGCAAMPSSEHSDTRTS